jgi:hypothetical protein
MSFAMSQQGTAQSSKAAVTGLTGAIVPKCYSFFDFAQVSNEAV